MDLKSELKSRTWPTRPEIAYSSYPVVTEGRMFNRALQLPQDLSEPIPPGECAITSLALMPRGGVMGATSGKRAHLFHYSAHPMYDGVHDAGVIPNATAVRKSLVVASDATVLGGVSETADGKAGRLFRWKYEGIEMLGVPVAGECVAGMTIDPGRNLAYGISTKSGTLFSADVRTGKVSVKGRVIENGDFSHTLVADKRGRIFGAAHLGRLFMFDPALNEIRPLALSLPTIAGREYYNRLDSAALDPASGIIYGAGSADGVVFALDPEAMTIRSLGKVIAEPRCRAITVGLDGCVYGVAGEHDGMGHLFRYDPAAHELRDLGIPAASSERSWHGYEFEAACTGKSGEIYLGESDRISHLFIYFPPIRPSVQGVQTA
jgi:hypothetical protein